MKKIKYLILLIFPLILTFSGCRSKSLNVKKEANEQCRILLDCFSKNDTDGIKALFCSAVSDSANFDNDLLEAVEFFEGEVTSYDLTAIGSDQKSEYGKTKTLHVSPKIRDIETSAGKSYKISYYAYLINSDNQEYVGISEIQIKSEDGKVFRLGNYSLANPK